jgi:hypothetical protein
MDLVRPTARGIEHAIPPLKRQDTKELRSGAAKGRSTLMVYAAAIIDFQYAYHLKQSKSIYILTAWKDNLAPMTAMPREIDRATPANALVISDETLYFNNTPGVWRRITAMDFLPSTSVHCETCDGQRDNPTTLEVTLGQKNIGQVLAMTIDEASAFFESQPRIAHPLRLMADTGLGYLQLGQASPTLPGGEPSASSLSRNSPRAAAPRPPSTTPPDHNVISISSRNPPSATP